jgi:hypothetical protein
MATPPNIDFNSEKKKKNITVFQRALTSIGESGHYFQIYYPHFFPFF